MAFVCLKVESPLGEITLCDDGKALCGVWFEGQKYFGMPLSKNESLDTFAKTNVLTQASLWLDSYFAGNNPSVSELSLAFYGSEFQKAVWEELLAIPYGSTATYGEIAKAVEAKTNKRVSSIAVGGAVGHNPISIIVPCHRVLGSNGKLTGYAGGLERKFWLLNHEAALSS